MDGAPVLVVGGTRGTGRLAAELLRTSGAGVRVLARDPDRAAAALGAGIDIVAGDITQPQSLRLPVRDIAHIVFTAGVRSGRFAREPVIEATEYEGVLNTLAAAAAAGFGGRFVYMTSMGVATRSIAGTLLNLVKGNTLAWRRRVEDALRRSGVDFTIVRAGFLVGGAARQRALEVTQGALPLSPRRRIARADVAEGLVALLSHPRASRATFEVAWGAGPRRGEWHELLDQLKPG